MATSIVEQVTQQLKAVYLKSAEPLEFNLVAVGVTALVTIFVLYQILKPRTKGKLPPMYPYKIPYLGSAIEYGVNPAKLFLNGYKRFGEIFQLRVAGQTMTMMVGPDAQKKFFETPEEELCARKAYTFTIPVFGKNIVYDSDHDSFQQQRRFISGGLTKKRFEKYVSLILEESEMYVKEAWKSGSGQTDMMDFFNELLVNTAARCLQGDEIRSALEAGPFSRLMGDLDRALSAVSYFFPYWPLPVNLRRDKARKEIVKIFQNIIKQRESTGTRGEDMLQVFMDSSYTDGRKLTHDEIAGLCVALMLAGQHTSNVTSAWLGSYIMTQPGVKERVLAEMNSVVPQGAELDFNALKNMTYLNNCLKETLRLNPPIVIVQRYAEVDFHYKDYTVPKGTLIAVSPTVAHRLDDIWANPESFDPERFERKEDKAKQYSYLAFSAGRHACIGEQFANVQIKTVWFYLLRHYDINLVSGKMPEPDYTTMIVSPVKPLISYKKL